jgi:hypothetical protein
MAFASDIVDAAVCAGRFNALIKPLQKAGPMDTPNGRGPFTVFASTDGAFAKLPAGTLEAVLWPKQKLAIIVAFHVVPGKIMAGQVQTGQVKTVEGPSLTVGTTNGAVLVNNAEAVKAGIAGSDGVIRVLDAVLVPNREFRYLIASARCSADRNFIANTSCDFVSGSGSIAMPDDNIDFLLRSSGERLIAHAMPLDAGRMKNECPFDLGIG